MGTGKDAILDWEGAE